MSSRIVALCGCVLYGLIGLWATLAHHPMDSVQKIFYAVGAVVVIANLLVSKE